MRCGIACDQTTAAQATNGVAALMSVGFAAGLTPGVPTGTVILPETIASMDGDSIAVHDSWHSSLREELTVSASARALLQVDEVLTTQAAKVAASHGGRYAAADMESYTLAAWCREAGIPFVALRIVLDDVGSEVPRALAEGAEEAGIASVLRALRSEPSALVRFLKSVWTANKAMFDALHRLAPAQLDVDTAHTQREPVR